MKKSSCMAVGSGVSRRLTWLMAIACGVLISGFGIGVARAQGAAQDEIRSGPTASDKAAANEATVVYRHAKPANTAAGAALKRKEIATGRGASPSASAAAGAATATPADNDFLRYLGDLTYSGGAVARVAEQHPIFLLPNGRCPIASCWGNPEAFLRDQNASEFIHITDQYVRATANNRYPVGAHKLINYKPTPRTAPLTDNDMIAFVHTVAASLGQTGYAHMYHVFLPPGQDVCPQRGTAFAIRRMCRRHFSSAGITAAWISGISDTCCTRWNRSRTCQGARCGRELRTGNWWIQPTTHFRTKCSKRSLIRMEMRGLTSQTLL